jgi:Fe-S cluster biogenesis protein NfuA
MNSDTTEKDRLYSEVLAALDKIRPYLEADGGDVKIVEINDDNVVMIELLGACGSCPMSTMTMKAGVEEAVKRAVPEIKSVEAINITPLEYL